MGSALTAYTILPSTVPNLAMLGAAESIYRVSITYGQYLAANFPIMGVTVIFGTIVSVSILCREEPQRVEFAVERPPISAEQRRLLVILLVTIGFWATDFLHGISPAWVTLGAAMLCMLPRIGPLALESLGREINFTIWFVFATLLSLGATIAHTGLGEILGKFLITWFGIREGADVSNFVAVLAIGKIVALIATTTGAPAIMTPLAQHLAESTGWPLETVLMLQIPSWMITLVPYESTPLALAVMLGGVRFGRAIRVLLPVAALGIVVALPLQFFWLWALGYLP